MSGYPRPRDMYLSKEIICVALAVPLLIAFGLVHSAYAFDADDIDITLSKTETYPASRDTEIVRVVLRLTNNGNEKISVWEDDFELIDSQGRKYEADSVFDYWQLAIHCNDNSISLNPGTTKGIELCFEGPRDSFQYDSIIMYGDTWRPSIANSVTISLIEDGNANNQDTLPSGSSAGINTDGISATIANMELISLEASYDLLVVNVNVVNNRESPVFVQRNSIELVDREKITYNSHIRHTITRDGIETVYCRDTLLFVGGGSSDSIESCFKIPKDGIEYSKIKINNLGDPRNTLTIPLGADSDAMRSPPPPPAAGADKPYGKTGRSQGVSYAHHEGGISFVTSHETSKIFTGSDTEGISASVTNMELISTTVDATLVVSIKIVNDRYEVETIRGHLIDLIDMEKKSYSSKWGQKIDIRGETITYCDAPTAFIHARTSDIIEACFELPKGGVEFYMIKINSIDDTRDALIIPLAIEPETMPKARYVVNPAIVTGADTTQAPLTPSTRSTTTPTASISSPQSIPEDKTADRQIDWIAGISFEIPGGWQVRETTDHDSIKYVFTTQSDGLAAHMDIIINPELGTKNIEDMSRLSYESITIIENDYKTDKIRVENAAPFAYIQNSIVVDEDDRQTRLGLKVVVIEHEDSTYWLGYRNNLDQFEEHLATFNRLVSSLRIGLSPDTTYDETSDMMPVAAPLPPGSSQPPMMVVSRLEDGKYTNPAGTMTFEVPEGWKIGEYRTTSANSYHIILKDKPTDHNLDIAIRAEPKNGRSLVEFVDNNRAQGWKMDPRMTKVISEERGVGVHSGLHSYVQYADGAVWSNGQVVPIWVKGAILEGEDMFYYFVYAGRMSEYNDGLDAFHGMLSSLEIADRTPLPSGACLIATAAHGTELSSQVQTLREVRDGTLLSTGAGTAFMDAFSTVYYSFSPAVADMERQSPALKGAVAALATPMLHTMSLMSLAEPGSEASVLAIGISVITLNMAAYTALPAVTMIAARRLRGTGHSDGLSRPLISKSPPDGPQ